MGDIRLWQGSLLLALWITSCQVPAASHRTSSPDATPPTAVPAKADEQATLKIASPIRDVLQRMHDDGVTPANVATRSATDYSTPFVRVADRGLIHANIAVSRVTPDIMSDLRALQVQQLQTHASQTNIQGWVPFDRVATVAALPFVLQIQPPRYATRR